MAWPTGCPAAPRVTPRPTDTPASGNAEETRQLTDRGLSYRVIYARSALAIPGRMTEIWRGIQQGERARVAGDVPMKMLICDDRLAVIPVMTGGKLAEAAYCRVIEIFYMAWCYFVVIDFGLWR